MKRRVDLRFGALIECGRNGVASGAEEVTQEREYRLESVWVVSAVRLFPDGDSAAELLVTVRQNVGIFLERHDLVLFAKDEEYGDVCLGEDVEIIVGIAFECGELVWLEIPYCFAGLPATGRFFCWP